MTTTTRIGMLVAVVVLAACGQEAKLQQLQISPVVTEVTEHLQADVVATAVYSDGSRKDVTAEVTWSTVDAAVASAAAGRVRAGQPGSTYLTASFAGLETSARVDVLAATLLSLQLTTDTASLPAGVSAAAVVLGTFSDGSTRDVTASVEWSAPAELLEVSGGTVRAIAPGHGELRATVAGTVAVLALDVTEAEATALSVVGLPAALPLGLSAPFQVLARFTDGTLRDVTAQAAVEVADAAVAALDGAALRGLAPGATRLTARFAGLSAEAPLQVAPAALVSIAVTCPKGHVKRGDLLLLSAAGTFSDGSVQDLTAQVSWLSGDTKLAVVSSYIMPGAVLAFDAGTVTLTAIDPASQVSGSFELVISK